jgi:hypothetical protein
MTESTDRVAPGGDISRTRLYNITLRERYMSVRLIAKDLYRIIREVERLEKELLAAPTRDHEILKDRLRKAKAERDQIRRSLEGSKDVANVLKKKELHR